MFKFLRHISPSFSRNEHGHILFTVEGAGLSGRTEFDLLQRKYDVDRELERCLTSGEYDEKHRLIAGQQYHVALLPNTIVATPDERTGECLAALALERFGYGTPPAGIIPALRWKIHNRRLGADDMGYFYVMAYHEPIADHILYLSSYAGDDVCARKVTPPDAFRPHWNDQGATAFLARHDHAHQKPSGKIVGSEW